MIPLEYATYVTAPDEQDHSIFVWPDGRVTKQFMCQFHWRRFFSVVLGTGSPPGVWIQGCPDGWSLADGIEDEDVVIVEVWVRYDDDMNEVDGSLYYGTRFLCVMDATTADHLRSDMWVESWPLIDDGECRVPLVACPATDEEWMEMEEWLRTSGACR